jgi:hypothetical protein
MDGFAGSKLGADIRATRLSPLTLARGLRPRCIPGRDLCWSCTPAEMRSASRHLTNRTPVGWAATACPVASTIRVALLPRSPQRQRFRPPTSDDQGALPLGARAGAFAPLHPRRKAFRLSAPDQPHAGWMGGNGLSRCIDNQGCLAPPIPPASAVSSADTRRPRSLAPWSPRRSFRAPAPTASALPRWIGTTTMRLTA